MTSKRDLTQGSRLPRRGGVYYVKDALITLLPREGREPHKERRTVIVLSSNEMNNNTEWLSVLAVPTSSEPTRVTPFCVEIPKGEGHLNKQTWARVPAVQPLEKADLQDFIGDLPTPRLNEILSSLGAYILAY